MHNVCSINMVALAAAVESYAATVGEEFLAMDVITLTKRLHTVSNLLSITTYDIFDTVRSTIPAELSITKDVKILGQMLRD